MAQLGPQRPPTPKATPRPSAAKSAAPLAPFTPPLWRRLLKFALFAPWRALRWSQRHPRGAVIAVFSEIIVRHVVLPPLLLAAAPTIFRAFFSSGAVIAVDRVISWGELIAGGFSAIAVLASLISRSRAANAQRRFYEKLVRDPTEGSLAHIYFTPGSPGARPSLEEMANVFMQFATQMPAAHKVAQLLKGAPTFSFEILRSAHYRGGQPQLFLWAPKSGPDVFDALERAFRAGLKAETGAGTLVRLADEFGGNEQAATRTQIRGVLGLATEDLTPQEAAKTHVALQRLTLNPAAHGYPLVRWEPKREPDYLSQLLAQMKVAAHDAASDSVGVQLVLRRVDESYWGWALKPLLDKINQLGAMQPKDSGLPSRVLKEALSAGQLFSEKHRSPCFQIVINIFATFRGDDATQAQAAVDAMARYFREGRTYRFAPAPGLNEEVAALPVFVPLTPQDVRPIVTSFGQLTRAQMLERARDQLTGVRVRDLEGPGPRPLRIVIALGRFFERAVTLATDRVRLAVAASPLGPLLSRTAQFYREDPLAGFDPRGASAAPTEPAALSLDDRPEMSLEQLFEQMVAPPEAEPSAPEPAPEAAAASGPSALADGLSREEEHQLSPEAKLVYASVVGRVYPVQLPAWLASPEDKHLDPPIGVVSVDELPMLFHLPKDLRTGLQAKQMLVPEEPQLGFRTKYAEDSSRITFGTGKSVTGEPVYVQVSKVTLRSHVQIVSPPRTGKSEMLRSLIFQYAKDGHGCLVIEPTGDLIGKVIRDIDAHLPERRNDIFYWSLTNVDRPIGINLLERPANPDNWSDQIEDIIDALNEVGARGAVREDGMRMMGAYMPPIIQALWRSHPPFENVAALQLALLDEDFRTQLALSTTHPNTRIQLMALAELPPAKLQNNIDTSQRRVQRLMANIRWMRLLAQPKTGFDPAKIMADRRIMLVQLTGDQDALVARFLLGKFYEAMTSRPADNTAHDFPIIVDEFSKYAGRARIIAQFIAEARKYSMPIYIVHQTESQAEAGSETDKLRDALSNVNTRWTFQQKDPGQARSFASKTAGRVSPQDVLLLPNSRTGYLLAENEVMTVTSLDTSKLGEDLPASSGAGVGADEPTPELPMDELTLADLPAGVPGSTRPEPAPYEEDDEEDIPDR